MLFRSLEETFVYSYTTKLKTRRYKLIIKVKMEGLGLGPHLPLLPSSISTRTKSSPAMWLKPNSCPSIKLVCLWRPGRDPINWVKLWLISHGMFTFDRFWKRHEKVPQATVTFYVGLFLQCWTGNFLPCESHEDGGPEVGKMAKEKKLEGGHTKCERPRREEARVIVMI